MRVFFRSLSLLLGFFSVQIKADEKEVNIAGWSTASQSAVDSNWYPQNALDGNPYTCTHTVSESDPWWKLDLLNVYTVNRVVITNRRDCCSERINGAEIRIGIVSSNVSRNPICAVISSIPAGASYNYSCNRMVGRYVFVVIPGDSRILTLCEVEVNVDYPVNIAGGGTASQSTLHLNSEPKNALDRNPSTCAHTPSQSDPWWKLDLLKAYSVNRVVITNRRDCCSERINGAEIRVGNVSSDAFSNPICAVISSIPAGASYNYSCNRMEGRYVFVVIPRDSRILTLCEVEVYVAYPGFFSVQTEGDEKEVNVAGGGTTSQSAVDSIWYPQYALDGNPYICASTPSQSNPWWKLDLLKMYSVNRVVITNRRDCCSERINGAEIRVGNVSSDVFSNPICAVISSIPAGASYNYSCNRMEGRYVFVVIPGDSRILTLCEVKVYVAYPGFVSVQIKADDKEVNVAGGGTANQSAVAYNWYPQNALDGNPSTCTHTPVENDPWWKLNLMKVYTVNRVVITNRRDCCSERINGAEIRIGKVSSDAFSNPICAVISSIPAGASYSYSCNGMVGRYVFVVIPRDSRILTLCEVEVYVAYPGNLAMGGSVTQSSTYTPWFAEQAIDFNPGFFTQPSLTCSSTNIQTNPWWRLDLGHIYRISRVVVTNRRDCCTEQINGAEIHIGNSLDNNGNNNPVCAVISSIPAGVSSTYTCNDMEGRYVNLIIPGTSRFLTMCEVEVYGGNLAIGGRVTQSSTYSSWIAGQAIDSKPGFTQPSLACSSTTNQTNPWWRLDLRNTYRVSKVVVTNRRDCCPERINGAEIHIGNSLENNGNNNPVCAVISSIPAGVSSTYTCNDMEGRYVNLIIPGKSKFLTLCEVEVYSEGLIQLC